MSTELDDARRFEEKYSSLISNEERPLFHLTPYIGWMNDPNGFSYYQGQYHMFYQYYPYDVHSGPMHWGHAVSDDMIKWKYLPCALAPDESFDKGGCFSGSALTAPDGKHVLMYTGVNTIVEDDGKRLFIQKQCIAIGDGLNYEKSEQNPVIDSSMLPEGGSIYDFRDPKIWQEKDGTYACVVANRAEDGCGQLLIYRSDDLKSWHFDCVLERSYGEYGKMWECPDFFELDGKQIILVSPQDMNQSGLEFHNGNGTMCIIGTYDKVNGFNREDVQAIDYGLDFYATQTIMTPDGRRVMSAWMQNWDAISIENPDQRWFGQLCMPRELSIRENRLIQNPVREIEAYRSKHIHQKTVIESETSLPEVYGRTIDLTVDISPSSELYEQFKIKVANGSRNYTLISFKPKTSILHLNRNNSGSCRDFAHDRKCLVRPRDGKIKLRVLIDRFSVEIFVNDGEQALTATLATPLSAVGVTFESVGAPANVEVDKYSLDF